MNGIRDYGAIEKTSLGSFDVGNGGARVGSLIGQLRWLSSMGLPAGDRVGQRAEQIEPLQTSAGR